MEWRACTQCVYTLYMRAPPDIVVVGSGPAGLAAATACVAAGLSTTLLAPDPTARWQNGYGLWPDELTDARLASCVSVAWDAVEVRFGQGDTHRVHRRYARVDNEALQRELFDRAPALRLERGEAVAIAHDMTGSTVQLADGRSMRGAVVVDATGPASALVRRTRGPTAFQAAWGEIVDTDDLDPSTPRWMDWSPAAGPRDPASFLYALPLGGSRWLLEETSLAGRPCMDLDVLRGRLHARLAREGVRIRAHHAVERVRIGLDTPIPEPQRTVGYGAAGAMVHPATGYMLARALGAAPALADALARGLDLSPESASLAAYDTIWPATRVRRRALHLYGAEIVAGLNQADTIAFFRAFFLRLSPRTVRDWLSDALPPAELATAMVRVFPGFPARVKWRAARGDLRHLVRAARP